MARLQQAGIEIDLLPGWEGRIFTRPASEVVQTTPSPTPQSVPETGPVEEPRPILHAASFALPNDAGDFGGGAVETMRSSDVFLAVVDYGSEAAGTALFAAQGIPRPLRTDQFDPATLQRTLQGQSGTQRFFTTAGRGFCLYVVLGAHLLRPRLVPLVNEALRSVRVS